MTKITFSYEDAVATLRNYHCLSNTAEIAIEPAATNQPTKSRQWYEDCVHAGNLTSDHGTGKIPAIKKLRELTGLGLKDAKHVIDATGTGNACSYNEFDREIRKLYRF